MDELINPPRINWYDSEIRHLMKRADTNKDFVLSKDEISKNYHYALESSFTAHGDIHHNEL